MPKLDKLSSLIWEGAYDDASKYLAKNPSSYASKKGSDGRLPIHLALQMKAPLPLIKALVSAYPVGAARIANQESNTPLLVACMYEQPVEVLEMIVDAGKSVAEVRAERAEKGV